MLLFSLRDGRKDKGVSSISVILVDRIGSIVLHNGLLRVDCITAGPNNEERAGGTLLIPGNRAAAVLQSLVGAVQELDKRLREQAQQAANAVTAEAGTEPSPPPATKAGSRAGQKKPERS